MGLTSCCILQPGGNSYRARGLNNFNPLLKLIYFHNLILINMATSTAVFQKLMQITKVVMESKGFGQVHEKVKV